MNAESSRSHSIFVITVTQKNVETGSAKSGQLFLVDLAGSEKVGKTGASGQTLEEAKKINKSLSALGMVINSLTDGKSTHVPYRDSKLTRILQESLGGNSRTTLIINCSPAAYNDAETLSTLRFGMRAKSIKNRAKVNAELSPAELKAHLRKAKQDAVTYQEYSTALEGEVMIWRTGGSVSQEKWAKLRLDGMSSAGASLNSANRVDALRELTGSPVQSLRSGTPLPGTATLERDEKDEFLRRENELQDQIAERESALSRHEESMLKMKTELEALRGQSAESTKQNEDLTARYNDLKMAMEKTAFEQKEAYIMMDSLKDANTELTEELETVKKALLAAKLSSPTLNGEMSTQEKELKKAEKMRAMMAGFTISSTESHQLQQIVDELDSTDELRGDALSSLKNKLKDSRSHFSQAEQALSDRNAIVDSLTDRKAELETRLHRIETEYQDLLEKTLSGAGISDLEGLKRQFAQTFEDQRGVDLGEIKALKATLSSRTQDLERLQDELKTVQQEPSTIGFDAANGHAGRGKTINQQLAEFDSMKKSLMRDLQTRCERVVELEIALDETREQYNNVLRNTNNRAQQKKMAFLERNLEQLTNVQRQLVEQNSSLKKEVAIAERKLIARNERISSLETLLGDAQEKLSQQHHKFENQLQAVRDRLESARKGPGGGLSIFGSGKIAKPLRGGAPTEIATSPPLQAVKTENKRSSWFSRGLGSREE